MIRLATKADVLEVAQTAYTQDISDYISITGSPNGYIHSVVKSYELSDVCYAVVQDISNNVVAVFGVVGDAVGGNFWYIGTEGARFMLKGLLIDMPILLADLCAQYKLLHCYVKDSLRKEQAWIRRLGFRISEPFSFGSAGELFCNLEMRG